MNCKRATSIPISQESIMRSPRRILRGVVHRPASREGVPFKCLRLSLITSALRPLSHRRSPSRVSTCPLGLLKIRQVRRAQPIQSRRYTRRNSSRPRRVKHQLRHLQPCPTSPTATRGSMQQPHRSRLQHQSCSRRKARLRQVPWSRLLLRPQARSLQRRISAAKWALLA